MEGMGLGGGTVHQLMFLRYPNGRVIFPSSSFPFSLYFSQFLVWIRMDYRHGRSASINLTRSSKGLLTDTKKASITTKVTELVLHSKTKEDNTIMAIPTSPTTPTTPTVQLQRSISGKLFKSSLKRHASVNDSSAFLDHHAGPDQSFNTFGVTPARRGPRRRNASVSDMFNHIATSLGAKTSNDEPDLVLPARRYSVQMSDYEIDILIGNELYINVDDLQRLPSQMA